MKFAHFSCTCFTTLFLFAAIVVATTPGPTPIRRTTDATTAFGCHHPACARTSSKSAGSRCHVVLANSSKSSLPVKHSSHSTPGAAVTSIARSLATTCILLTLPLIAIPTPAFAASNDIERGSTLFFANCAGCHAGGLNFVQENKTLKKEALAKFVMGSSGTSPDDLNQATVQQWVMKSGQHNRIVFYKAPGGKLSEQDWADVTTFVVDQALNDKW